MDACNEGDERMLADPQMQEAFGPGDLCDADGGEKLDGRTGRRLEREVVGAEPDGIASVRRAPEDAHGRDRRARRERNAIARLDRFDDVQGRIGEDLRGRHAVGKSVDLGGPAELGQGSLVEGRRVAAEQQRLRGLRRGIDEDGA